MKIKYDFCILEYKNQPKFKRLHGYTLTLPCADKPNRTLFMVQSGDLANYFELIGKNLKKVLNG